MCASTLLCAVLVLARDRPPVGCGGRKAKCPTGLYTYVQYVLRLTRESKHFLFPPRAVAVLRQKCIKSSQQKCGQTSLLACPAYTVDGIQRLPSRDSAAELNRYHTMSLCLLLAVQGLLTLDAPKRTRHIERCQPRFFIFAAPVVGRRARRHHRVAHFEEPCSKLVIYMVLHSFSLRTTFFCLASSFARFALPSPSTAAVDKVAAKAKVETVKKSQQVWISQCSCACPQGAPTMQKNNVHHFQRQCANRQHSVFSSRRSSCWRSLYRRDTLEMVHKNTRTLTHCCKYCRSTKPCVLHIYIYIYCNNIGRCLSLFAKASPNTSRPRHLCAIILCRNNSTCCTVLSISRNKK